MSEMTGEAGNELALVQQLSVKRVYLQRELKELPAAMTIFCSLGTLWGISRKEIHELHFAYEPVPGVYLLSDVFDRFFDPPDYLRRLADELDVEIHIFLEALGCYVQLDENQRERLNAYLEMSVPALAPGQRNGLVLMCWDRIDRAGEELNGAQSFLLDVVGIHEHSHAARSASLFQGNDPRLLQAEETVAQWETYMFLRSRKHSQIENTIETMKRLMEKQPSCYQIPI